MTTLAIVALVLLVAAGLGRKLLTVRTTGSPWGPSARIGDAIVTMVTRLEPYLPSLHRNPDNDRYTIGLLVHSARNPSVRRFLRISSGQRTSNLNQARITDVDGNRIWFIGPEPGAYDVKSGDLERNPGEPPASKPFEMADLATGDDAILLWLAAGGFTAQDRWLGVLNDAEAASGFKPGASLSETSPVERSREPRRLWTAAIDRGDGSSRIRGLEPVPGDGMLNAAFLRKDRQREILSLDGGGFLLTWESKPYRDGTVMVTRIGLDGTTVWTLDSGIQKITGIFPDPAFPALIGERPRIPDKLSEPILVVIDAATGKVVTHSLWLMD